jgi:hypothetical protein
LLAWKVGRAVLARPMAARRVGSDRGRLGPDRRVGRAGLCCVDQVSRSGLGAAKGGSESRQGHGTSRVGQSDAIR